MTEKKATPVVEGGQQIRVGSSVPKTEAERFLQLLGKDPAATWVRTLKPVPGKGTLSNVSRQGADLHGFDPAALEADNQAGSSIYLITGDAEQATGKHKKTGKPTGCVDDLDVHSCRAVFVEWDDRPIEWQVQAWQELGLPEPTVMVKTGGKSIHCYWRLTEPRAPDEWRVLQRRLIDYAGGDKYCKNPSRLMRLPGYRYVDKGTGEVTNNVAELIHQADVAYTVAEIEACLPASQPVMPPTPAPLLQPLAPREVQEIRDAVALFPSRSPQTYEQYRNALCGCSAALSDAGVGDADGEAIRLMAHLWEHGEGQARQILQSTTTRNAASFWGIAREHGYDLKRSAATTPATAPRAPQLQDRPTASGIKPITLKAGEIVAALPRRVGAFRLNTRSQEIHAGDQVTSANAISRLYLTLSNQVETWPKEATYDAAMQLAQQNAYDPVEEYLRDNNATPLPIEDWQHLDQYLLGIDDPIAAAFLPRYLMAAVARTREPGCDFRQAPVLVGPQWIGKTALGQILFGSKYFVSGVGDLGKDALMCCHTGWGVELAELDGITRKADQEELKRFISETSDVFRLPYDKATERWPRRFLFWGTSNGAALRDITGSSRYVCIAVERMLPLDRVTENRDAIWRRALLQYEAGENWKDCDQESREAIFERNDNYSEEDPWLQVVADFLEHKRKTQDLPVQIAAILEKLEVPQERRSNQLSTRVQRLAVALGWRTDRRTINGKRVKGVWPPATPATPVAHQRQGGATPPKGNADNGSERPATPGTPTKEELVDKGEELCSEAGGTVPDTFERGGVAAASNPPKTLHCSRSELLPRGGRRYAPPATGVAAVGSGADVFTDDDDPHWGPRPGQSAQ